MIFFSFYCFDDLLQVLAHAQHARQNANYEQSALHKQMQEFVRQVDEGSRRPHSGNHTSPSRDSVQPYSRNSHKLIEAVMHSTAEGKVHIVLIN